MINGIDNTPPKLSFTTSVTTKSITITVTATDPESGIYGYAFSKDVGITWTEWKTGNVYTFNNLKTGTYDAAVKAYNGTYGSEASIKEIGTTISPVKKITLSACPTPTYSIDNTDCAQQKTVTINYGSVSGCSGSYSIDGETTWKSGTSVLVETNNQNVIAKNTDGKNTTYGSTFKAIKIDRTVPDSVTFTTSKTIKTITVTASATDNESGIAKYAFSKDNGTTWTTWQNSDTYTYNSLTSGTSYNVKVKVYNGTYGSTGATESYGASESSSLSVKTTKVYKSGDEICFPVFGCGNVMSVNGEYVTVLRSHYLPTLDTSINGCYAGTYTGPITTYNCGKNKFSQIYTDYSAVMTAMPKTTYLGIPTIGMINSISGLTKDSGAIYEPTWLYNNDQPSDGGSGPFYMVEGDNSSWAYEIGRYNCNLVSGSCGLLEIQKTNDLDATVRPAITTLSSYAIS